MNLSLFSRFTLLKLELNFDNFRHMCMAPKIPEYILAFLVDRYSYGFPMNPSS